MDYNDITLKKPIESKETYDNSMFLCKKIEDIINEKIETQENLIEINTNLKNGIPMENINKIAGPFVEAWAQELFHSIEGEGTEEYRLINVEDGTRLGVADVILQFKKENKILTGNIDVKSTSIDIKSSGKSPNITSYKRIRSAYVEDPDFIFIILSLKHTVYSVENKISNTKNAIMEVKNVKAYDLKYISEADINYNPALGTGQIQIRDIHYVAHEKRDTLEFCIMLDKKFIKSKKGFDEWLKLAVENEYIKITEEVTDYYEHRYK